MTRDKTVIRDEAKQLVCKCCHLHTGAVVHHCRPVVVVVVFLPFSFCDFITDLYKCPETDVGRHREGQADRHSNRSVSDRKRPVSPI